MLMNRKFTQLLKNLLLELGEKSLFFNELIIAATLLSQRDRFLSFSASCQLNTSDFFLYSFTPKQ